MSAGDHNQVRTESGKLPESNVRSSCTVFLPLIEPSASLQKLIKRYGPTDEQLNSEIEYSDFPYLVEYFDGVTIYSSAMGLTLAEQADLNALYHARGTQVAMTECLTFWKRHDTSVATYKALLEMLLGLRKEETAHQICQHLTQCG